MNHYLNPITGANHTPTTYNSTIIPWVANFFAREWNKKLCLTPGVDAATQAASGLASSSATLNAALISANATTKYYFEYGTTTNYGMRTVTNTVAGSVNTTNVSAAISGLAASTLHHFRAGISNAAGTQVSTDATFTTASAGPTPPGISAQPQSQPVCAGNNVSFAVTATGSTPFSYQWSKGTAQISNATSSTLAITGVTAGDAANYSVVITNAYGSATSSVAVLTVNSAPGISAQPQNATNNVGTSVTFSVTTGGAAPLTYQWRKGGSNVSGTTNSSYTITNVARGDAGNYDVVITNACGAVTSSAATLSVNVTDAPSFVVTFCGCPVTLAGPFTESVAAELVTAPHAFVITTS